MSQKDILSQAEIDALMEGLGSAGALGVPGPVAGEVAAFDWQALPRITRGASPALEVVNQRLLRGLKGALAALLGQAVAVSLHSSATRRYRDFLEETPVPSGCAIVNLQPLAGQGLLVCDLALADVVVDLLHGGSGKLPGAPDARSLASIGRQAVQRLLGAVMAACTQAWSGVADLTFTLERIHTDVRQAPVATALDQLNVSVFQLQVGDVLGHLSVCLPLATLSPLRGMLQSPTWGDFVHSDRRWRPLLSREIEFLTVPLQAHCAPIESSVAKMLAMKAGDFIEIGGLPQRVATPEGLPLFEGSLQTQSGHQAIRIERVLAGDGDDGGGL